MGRFLTVFGATGQQGGSVIRHVLSHPVLKHDIKIRAVTRDDTKPAAQALSKLGVEVVKADLNDPDSVSAAVKGSTIVFGVTNYWESVDSSLETKQGINIVNAVKSNEVSLLIWSSLPNVTEMTEGRLAKVYHYDSKARVEAYIRKENITAVFFHAGFYMPNITTKGVQKLPDRNPPEYAINFPLNPDAKVPLFNPEDTGIYVCAILLAPHSEVVGKSLYSGSDIYTPTQIAADFTNAIGFKTSFNTIPDQLFRSFLPDNQIIRDEMSENMALVNDPGYYGPKTAELVKETNHWVKRIYQAGNLTSWVEFVKNNYKV